MGFERFLKIVIGVVASLIVLLLIIAWPPSRRGLQNQRTVAGLLADARAVYKADDMGQIDHIAIGDSVTLLPEHSSTVSGYNLTVHIKANAFTIDARPVKIGATGMFPLFRDSNGVIRFEINAAVADEHSRQWGRNRGGQTETSP
jgi:hypothetical protein